MGEGLTLQVLAGPTAGPFYVEGEGPATLGRSMECDVCLLDDTVSRRHATMVCRRGTWHLTDESSRAGTFLNGVRLPRSFPVPLASGDLLRIGPWAMRVIVGRAAAPRHSATIDDSASRSQRIERLPSEQRTGTSDRRLRLLTECLERLSECADEDAAATTVLALVLKGSGYTRGAVLRRIERAEALDVEIIARLGTTDFTEMTFSRTLVEQAARGETVLLTEDAEPVASAHSLAEMGVHSAICVPISIAGPVTGFIYLDARGKESQVRSDAAGFCEAAATAYGLAVAAVKRADLERRQRELHAELDAAREVQTMVMPPPEGRMNDLRFAVQSRPGSFVVGDLVDLFALPEGRIAICAGDVSGHGVGAAMLMATAQAFLSAELRRLEPGEGPTRAIESLNRYLTAKPLAGRFLSLWVGIIDPRGEIRYCDAGHGHWLVIAREGALRRPVRVTSDGGIPVGIDCDAVYGEGTVMLNAGDELVVYSDGIIEQRAPGGTPFGVDRLIESVVRGGSASEDISLVFRALEEFAGTKAWDDDATVVAVERAPE